MAVLAGKVGSFWFSKKNALDFTAANNTVTIPDAATLDIASDMTLEVWCAIGEPCGDQVVNKNSGEKGWGISISASDALFTTTDGSTAETVQTTTKVNTDKWVHVVGTVEGTALQRIYLNGELEATATAVGTDFSNGSDLVFGPTVAGSDTRIGVVRLFGQAATAAEVSDLYHGKFPRSSMIGSLKGEWLFTEGTGTDLHDSSKNDNNGTIANASWVSTTYDTETSETLVSDAGRLKYPTAYENVDNENLTITVGGTAKTRGNDFEITPKGTLTFNTAVAVGDAVLAAYRHFPMTMEAGGFTNWSMDFSVDMLDKTDFITTGWREWEAGLKSWSGSAERFWKNSMYDLIGEKLVLKFYLDITDVTTDYLTAWGILSGINPSTPVDTLVTESISFQGTGVPGNEN